MLARETAAAQDRARQRKDLGWTTFQWSDQLLLDRLQTDAGTWQSYRDPKSRDATIERFKDYAYQWY